MKRFEIVAHKKDDKNGVIYYKNCHTDELTAVLIDWQLRMSGYESKIVKSEW